MSIWIKLETSTTDKPEVIKMARILRIDQDAVVGKLVRVWSWADQHSVDGCNVSITEAYIDRLTAAKGFAKALREVGWLEGEDGSLTFPRFDRHNGNSAKARALESEAKRLRRQMSDNRGSNVGQMSDTLSDPASDQRREEKRRSNNNDDNAQARGRAGAGENGGGGGACTLEEATLWAEGYSKGNVLMLVITPEIVHAWHDNRQASGWVTVKNQVELPIADWKADLRTYARSWRDRDRERSTVLSTKNQEPRNTNLPPKPESAWSLQQRITAAEDQIRRILGIDQFKNLSKADQDRITTIRTNIATWRRQLTEAPAA